MLEDTLRGRDEASLNWELMLEMGHLYIVEEENIFLRHGIRKEQ